MNMDSTLIFAMNIFGMEISQAEIIKGVIATVVAGLPGWLLKSPVVVFGKFLKKKWNGYKEKCAIKKRFGIESVENTRGKAYEKILDDIKKSEKIDSLSFKGGVLINGQYDDYSNLYKDLLANQDVRPKFYRFLLLSPDSEEQITERNNNLKKGITVEEHSTNINNCIKYLCQQKEKNKKKRGGSEIECRLFKESLKWSFLISEGYILLNFYEKEKRGQEASCYIIKKESLFGKTLMQYFNDLWERSDPVESPPTMSLQSDN